MIPKEEYNYLKSITLLDFMLNYRSDDLINKRKEYRSKTYSSLSIGKDGWWCHWASGQRGKTAIDFLIKIENMEFIDAMNLVRECVKTRPLDANVVIQDSNYYIKTSLKLPPKDKDNSVIIDYLVNKRGIDGNVVQGLINIKRIYQSEKDKDVVFVGYDFDDKTPKFASIRSTKNKDRKNVSGSNKEYSFRAGISSHENKLYVFEAVIDALSFLTYMNIVNNDNMWAYYNVLSLDGVACGKNSDGKHSLPVALNKYLQEKKEITDIILCLDNDEAGKNAMFIINDLLKNKYKVSFLVPKTHKDWNEYLIDFKKEREINKSKQKKKNVIK